MIRWRRRRDYPEQPRGCSDPSGFAAHAPRCQILLESYLVEPTVLIPFYRRLIKNASTKEALLIRWRRRRDSNPRYAINVYSLSRGAPSATRPLLRVLSLISFDTRLWTLPGSALLDAMRLALRVALVTRALLRNLRSLGQHSATSPKFYSITRKKRQRHDFLSLPRGARE